MLFHSSYFFAALLNASLDFLVKLILDFVYIQVETNGDKCIFLSCHGLKLTGEEHRKCKRCKKMEKRAVFQKDGLGAVSVK